MIDVLPWLKTTFWNNYNYHNYSKYQGAEEFHMLACIGVIVKLWFSVLSDLKSHIIIHPRGTNDDAPSNLWKPLKCTVKMGITPQNMPQISDSPLSSTK